VKRRRRQSLAGSDDDDEAEDAEAAHQSAAKQPAAAAAPSPAKLSRLKRVRDDAITPADASGSAAPAPARVVGGTATMADSDLDALELDLPPAEPSAKRFKAS
jgi:hypothetical protein